MGRNTGEAQQTGYNQHNQISMGLGLELHILHSLRGPFADFLYCPLAVSLCHGNTTFHQPQWISWRVLHQNMLQFNSVGSVGGCFVGKNLLLYSEKTRVKEIVLVALHKL